MIKKDHMNGAGRRGEKQQDKMDDMTFRGILKKKLTKKEYKKARFSYDILGSLAVVEIPDELEKKKRVIGRALLDSNKAVETVLKKKGGHTGRFRRQKYEVIAGKRKKTAEIKENRVRMRFHVEEAYFSSRFSTERLRIAKQVKKGEDVLVMFSGIAPFPLVISKNSEASHITGIELNRKAFEAGVKNIIMNNAKNVSLICGDVKKTAPLLRKKFDRIVMPLPKGGEDYLEYALMCAKKGAVIHYYDFLHQDELNKAKEKIRKACKRSGKKSRMLGIVKCGQQKAYVYRICADFKVL